MLLEFNGRLARAGINGEGAYHCPLTRQDMADFLGLIVVHLNRSFHYGNAQVPDPIHKNRRTVGSY
jgi:hypothetical protein